MEELIVVTFFKTVPDFFQIDPPYIVIFLLAFCGSALLEFLILRRKNPGWILPAVLLALELCCEWFYQTIRGWDALLFAIVGFVCLFGLAGSLCVLLIHIIRTKVRH